VRELSRSSWKVVVDSVRKVYSISQSKHLLDAARLGYSKQEKGPTSACWNMKTIDGFRGGTRSQSLNGDNIVYF
jgi:hypothetical protein